MERPYVRQMPYQCWRRKDEFTARSRRERVHSPLEVDKTGMKVFWNSEGGRYLFGLEWAVCSLAVFIPEKVVLNWIVKNDEHN